MLRSRKTYQLVRMQYWDRKPFLKFLNENSLASLRLQSWLKLLQIVVLGLFFENSCQFFEVDNLFEFVRSTRERVWF